MTKLLKAEMASNIGVGVDGCISFFHALRSSVSS